MSLLNVWLGDELKFGLNLAACEKRTDCRRRMRQEAVLFTLSPLVFGYLAVGSKRERQKMKVIIGILNKYLGLEKI